MIGILLTIGTLHVTSPIALHNGQWWKLVFIALHKRGKSRLSIIAGLKNHMLRSAKTALPYIKGKGQGQSKKPYSKVKS